MGISGRHPSLSCNFHATADEQKHMALNLVKLARSISDRHAHEYIRGTRKLQPTELKLRGKANWDSNLAVVQDTSPVGSWEQNEETIVVRHCSQVVFLSCPVCNNKTANSSRTFSFEDYDKLSRCSFCNKSSPIKKWICPCKVKWHLCREHKNCRQDARHPASSSKDEEKMCGRNPGSPVEDRKASKRAACDFDAVLAQDKARSKQRLNGPQGQKRKAFVVLDDYEPSPALRVGPSASLPRVLGPILAKRFPHLAASCALPS